MVQRVLLTGANGFHGTHILSQLLASNFSVRAIVRSQKKADQVRSDRPTASQQDLDFGIVPDITAPGAFDHVIKSDPPIDVVIHTASPFLYKAVSDNLKDFLIPAKEGTEEILKAIKAHAPSVRRVVVTRGAVKGDKGVGYRASKKYAERAAWDFVEREKPASDLVTLCPPMIYGPPAHHIPSPTQLKESNARIYNLFINSSQNAEQPPNGLYLYADVRDVVTVHIRAATVPEASNKRFIISQGQIGSQQISDILRQNIPELGSRTPEGTSGMSSLLGNAYSADSSPAEKVLGVKFRSAEDTFVDLGKRLLAIEAQRS